jgi:hypothetical protein
VEEICGHTKEQRRKIENLETRMKKLEDALAI